MRPYLSYKGHNGTFDVGKRFTLSASGGKKQVINRIYGVTAIPPPQESAFAIRRANIC